MNLLRRAVPELGASAWMVGVVVLFWALFSAGVDCRNFETSTWVPEFSVAGVEVVLVQCGSHPWTADGRLLALGLGLAAVGLLLALVGRRVARR
ncbi:hypothetical protein [Haloarchaeobius sp. DT45]|uniref:hypothetical protein n=1 Tax=Haloarchaeobius sp. DT45 TaxID=3446116 RepID=UPI003F6B92C8